MMVMFWWCLMELMVIDSNLMVIDSNLMVIDGV